MYPWPFLNATVDQRPATVLTSNAVASALVIAPGRHEVRLAAGPRPIPYALLTALVASALALWIGARQRRVN